MSVRSIAAWLVILAMWGCQSTPAPSTGERAPLSGEPQTAESLLQAAQAASGNRASRLYLQAAEGFLREAGIGMIAALASAPEAATGLPADPAAAPAEPAAEPAAQPSPAVALASAAAALVRVDASRLRGAEAARFQLATAQLALATGDLETARAALLALDGSALPEPRHAAVLNAEVLAASGRPADAAGALMDYAGEAARTESQDLQWINDSVWRLLVKVPAYESIAMADTTSGQPGGWWQLKAHMLQSLTLSDQRRRLDAWRLAWPEHPAAIALPTPLSELQQTRASVRRVALLLPLSGPLNRAGRAVRDGFIASYLPHRDEVEFEIEIYDVAAEPLGVIYERALLSGADLLIGPLAKDSVSELNALNPDIPALALNYLSAGEMPAPNVLQLGLAIEDEAATLNHWLADQNVEQLMVFHTGADWSMRAMQAVQQSWQGALTVQPIEDMRTVTESVGVAMQVAASQQRHDELEELLRIDLEFLPRARGDVEAIIALVTPLEVSALVPALRFHFASGIPVYATSQTIRGVEPDRLRSLNGFHVSELPWFIAGGSSYDDLNDAFDLQASAFAALYALGVDAFRLAERVPLALGGNLMELLGSTGELRFGADGRIDRRLARAVIRNGSLTGVSGGRSP